MAWTYQPFVKEYEIHSVHMDSCIYLCSTSFDWNRNIWPKHGRGQVNCWSKGSWIKVMRQLKHEFKHNFAYIFHSLLFSCLPGWKSDTGMDMAYMFYICIVGGLIPSMIIVVTNGYLLHTIHRVSLLEWFMLRLCNLI